MVANLPVLLVRDFNVVGKCVGLGEVDEPAAGVSSVVQEQQRAADDFMLLEELRVLQSGANRFESLNVSWL